MDDLLVRSTEREDEFAQGEVVCRSTSKTLHGSSGYARGTEAERAPSLSTLGNRSTEYVMKLIAADCLRQVVRPLLHSNKAIAPSRFRHAPPQTEIPQTSTRSCSLQLFRRGDTQSRSDTGSASTRVAEPRRATGQSILDGRS